MKRTFKKNQAILTLLAVMIAVAGYLNYIGESTGETAETVSSEEAAASQILEENQQAATEEESESQPGDAVFTSSEIVEFISQANLNKEQVRSENQELLQSIIDNENLSTEAKQDAVDQMVQMTAVAETENETETLLAAKGFESTVVSISGDSVDVVVGATELTDAQRAQIEDIVKRKTEISVENIVISLVAGTVSDTKEEESSETSQTSSGEVLQETVSEEVTEE
ncbi:MAG: SpoIIIAH-like family protein [Lachnospiraceae bacterium]|nr:SpoIIIAH-like family protein [Lachnospiraceae bacterium]